MKGYEYCCVGEIDVQYYTTQYIYDEKGHVKQ